MSGAERNVWLMLQMGAAAFIIAEYVNVPYVEVAKAAAVPAFASYAALLWITHVEACKLGLRGLSKDELPNAWLILRNGLHGIKMHPDSQQFNIDDERLFPVYEHLQDRIPVMLHMGDLRYNFSHPVRLKRVLELFPHLKVIAAHFGGYSMYETACQELKDKNLKFSETATAELSVMTNALLEIMSLAEKAFCENDLAAAVQVEPLEQVIDDLRERIRLNHTLRLQKNACTIENGFVLSDILTNLERVSDHCSNIAGCVLETSKDELDMHHYLASVRTESEEYRKLLAQYREKYSL